MIQNILKLSQMRVHRKYSLFLEYWMSSHLSSSSDISSEIFQFPRIEGVNA